MPYPWKLAPPRAESMLDNAGYVNLLGFRLRSGLAPHALSTFQMRGTLGFATSGPGGVSWLGFVVESQSHSFWL